MVNVIIVAYIAILTFVFVLFQYRQNKKNNMLKTWIEKSYVIHKYYDIMLIKRNSLIESSNIDEDDLCCFNEKEKNHLKDYLENLDELRKMQLKNPTLGQFMTKNTDDKFIRPMGVKVKMS